MQKEILDATVMITAAYLRGNHAATHEVPAIIMSVSQTLKSLGRPDMPAAPLPLGVERDDLLKHDSVTCGLCGFKATMIKNHLMRVHGLTPQAYRIEMNLPADFPIVAPEYSERRTSIAKRMGLGRKRVAF